MQLIDAKIICRLYALGLAALAISLAVWSGTVAAAGLLAVAVGLALLHPWAFLPAYAVPLLYICESVADATHLRWLRPSGVMPDGMGILFRSNLVVHWLLDRPARFFAWYGIPNEASKILLCLIAISALVYAHLRLRKSGLLGQMMSDRDKVHYLHIMAFISKVAVGLAVLIVAVAIWKDPPTGGRNPGGPSPGMTVGFAIILAGPWLIAGIIGWAVTAWLIRKNVRANTSTTSQIDRHGA